MTPGLYTASVPVFSHGLHVLADLLRKGELHMRVQGTDPESLLDLRLAPDMLPLIGQVQRASDHAKGASARLAGLEPPSFADAERSLADAYNRIDRTLTYIGTFSATAFEAAPTRIVVLPFDEPPMPAAQYLYGFAMPSFFFHLTTAYAILRHHGVTIGKRDFIGSLEST